MMIVLKLIAVALRLVSFTVARPLPPTFDEASLNLREAVAARNHGFGEALLVKRAVYNLELPARTHADASPQTVPSSGAAQAEVNVESRAVEADAEAAEAEIIEAVRKATTVQIMKALRTNPNSSMFRLVDGKVGEHGHPIAATIARMEELREKTVFTPLEKIALQCLHYMRQAETHPYSPERSMGVLEQGVSCDQFQTAYDDDANDAKKHDAYPKVRRVRIPKAPFRPPQPPSNLHR